MFSQQSRPEGHSRQPFFVPMQQQLNQSYQQQRPVQNFSPIPIYQPIKVNPNPQQVLSNKNLSSPSLNVKQLNQDLSKLKEQLKKLTEKGEEMGANKVRAEEAHSVRVKLQSMHQVHQIKGEHQRYRDASIDLIYYPSTTSQDPNLANKLANQLPSPPRRERGDYLLQRGQERGKIMTFRNPKKQEQQKASSSNEWHEGEKTHFEAELKQLRQKVSKLEIDLQISLLQKENLALEVKSLQQANQQLHIQTIKDREARSKFSIQTPSPSKEELKSSMIIQNLQKELAQVKRGSMRTSFDEALKSQLQENKLLKVRLDQRGQELQQAKDLLSHQQKVTESLKNQLSMIQLKYSAQLRGKQRKLQVQISDKANQLQTAKRALETLDLKYRNAVGQIKEKDEFIMRYVVGRGKESDREEIMNLFEHYRISFPQNRTIEDLLKQQREIQALKQQLKKLTQSQ